MQGRKKHLDFELNLVPFIDLLSVCICFLLITAVWLNIGSLNVKQAVGGQSQAETEKKPLLWAMLNDNGDVQLDIQASARVPAAMQKLKITSLAGRYNLEGLSEALNQLKLVEPELRTALLQPKAQTSYEDIIEIMDRFKQSGMADLGVAPL